MGANWDDEDESPIASPPSGAVTKAKKFDDEEEEADVIDSWDADDSEEERAKATKREEAEAKKKAEAAANKKSKSERIKEHQDSAARRAELEAQLAQLDADEDPNEKRERLRNLEIESDLASFQDLLANPGDGRAAPRKATTGTLVIQKTAEGEEIPIELASLPVFNPAGKPGFDTMKEKLVPLLTASAKKPHYPLFLGEFYRDCAMSMNSEQIKKLASSLTALANQKMKEEKDKDKKGGKKKIGAKAPSVTLGAAGAGKAGGLDTTNYDNDEDDYDDFM